MNELTYLVPSNQCNDNTHHKRISHKHVVILVDYFTLVFDNQIIKRIEHVIVMCMLHVHCPWSPKIIRVIYRGYL